MKNEVIDASRDFVCIRLATYENKSEAEFCAKLFTRNGALENTTYAVLSPDGKQSLIRASRGPRYRSAGQMASLLNDIAARYKTKDSASPQLMPYMENFDVALNVASCDSLPLVVVSGKNETDVDAMSDKLRDHAWSVKLGGQFVFASVQDTQKLKAITGAKRKDGILIVQPGTFGLTARLLKRLPSSASSDQIESAMTEVALANSHKQKNHGQHVSLGISFGIDWKTKIPVTDEQSLRAKERKRGGR